MRNRGQGWLLRAILWWQGLYYALAGFWAAISPESFSRVTEHYSDPFDTRSIAMLSVVLGLALVAGAARQRHRHFASFLLLGTIVATVIPEILYFTQIRHTLFLLDLPEEVAAAIATLLGLRWEKRAQNT